MAQKTNATQSIFCCPLCGKALYADAQHAALHCAKGHGFDLAHEGYVHLLPASKMHAKTPGDSKEMVAARSRFLQAGFYAPFSNALNEIVKTELLAAAQTPLQKSSNVSAAAKLPLLVDAGCGEGYYTNRLAAALGKGAASIAAFDISKYAVKAAAKQAAAQGALRGEPAQSISDSAASQTFKHEQNAPTQAPHEAPATIQYAVAGSYAIPLPAACAQVLINVFSPMAREEFLRVLRPAGLLVFAVPGARHLYGLKQVLYDEPYENAAQDVAYAGFVCEQRVPVRGSITVPAALVQDLFAMTPYYWKTPAQGAERLAAHGDLTCEIAFDFVCYRKQ